MQNKWRTSQFYRKLKELHVSRTAVVSAVVIVLSLSMVLAVTVATNRARKNDGLPATDPAETTPSETPETDDKPTGTTPDSSAQSIPEMSLPTQGKLVKKHSVDVQVFSQTMKDFRVHTGIDIATAVDAEVFAAAGGTVKKIWEDPMMGWCVALEHSGDCMTVYKNLAKELATGLAEGNSIQKGQLLGRVGDTALLEIADEPHLHMEMTVKGLQVDPLEYFSKAVLATLSQDTSFEQNANEGK